MKEKKKSEENNGSCKVVVKVGSGESEQGTDGAQP
jgi:hypothetical protein